MFPSPNSKFKKRCVALDKGLVEKQKKMQLPPPRYKSRNPLPPTHVALPGWYTASPP